MVLDDRPYTFDRVFRIAVSIALLYGLVRLLGYLSDVIIPFAVAFLLAYLLNPIVLWVQRRVKSRAAAVFLTLGGLCVALAALGMIVVPLIMQELGHMGHLLGKLVNDADLAQRAAQKLPPEVWETLRSYASEEKLRELLYQKDFWSLAQALARKVVPGVWGIVAGTTSFLVGLIGLFVILLYLVFLLLDYQRVKNDWKKLIPPSYRESVLEFLLDFDASMSRYFRAQAVLAGAVGAILALGFSIIGLPLGIVLGFFIGLLNMVPYLHAVGMIPAGFLAIVMALDSGGSVLTALLLTFGVFVLAQLIQDVILTPKIMGEATGMSPSMILLSISVWGKLLGFLGLVIALPITCLLLAYYHRLLAESS